jgi:phage FluMu gp28-like protein
LRIVARGKVGRIKVLASNPRTARGFSGDLILDEFAFHEDADAIWEAAEPILSSQKDFLCRIASTGNGSHNLFHRLAAPAVVSSAEAEKPAQGGLYISVGKAGYTLSRVTRTQAHWLGMKIFDIRTREEILPAVARERALDKRAYDQNYECAFDHSSYSLLTNELIDAAERPDVGIICEQNWSSPVAGSNIIHGSAVSVMELLRGCMGPLYVGFDIARKVDLSVITVMEKLGDQFRVRAILRMQDIRLPDQEARLREICLLPKFQRAAIDMTGLGFALVEHVQMEFHSRIQGINFASTVPVTNAIQEEGRKRETVRVTEALALELLQAYEDRRIQHPGDTQLRDDLCKPERITTPGGRVSIAATRDEAGHADHFWSFALAIEAAASSGSKFAYQSIKLSNGRRDGF